MKTIPRLAVLATLLWFDSAVANCEPKSEPATVAKPAASSRSEIRATLAEPMAGEPVRADTILTIDIEYQIAGFDSSEYTLSPTFRSGTYHSKVAVIDGQPVKVAVASPAGKVRMCLPLAQLYREAETVTWPLELTVTIFKTDAKETRTGVIGSRRIKLNTVDVPAAAIQRQAKAPPAEYDDALVHVFNEFERAAAIYKTCLRRLPALQPKLTSAYRAWELRHKADIDFVTALQFESLKTQSGGRPDSAMQALDLMAELQQQVFNALGAEQLRDACDDVIAQANPAEDVIDGIVGPYLEILRKWQAAQ